MKHFLDAAGGDISVWQDAWHTFTDPGHIIAELGWTIIQDVILVWLLYGTLWKKVILPRLHDKFDKEHAIVHVDVIEHIETSEQHDHDHKY